MRKLLFFNLSIALLFLATSLKAQFVVDNGETKNISTYDGTEAVPKELIVKNGGVLNIDVETDIWGGITFETGATINGNSNLLGAKTGIITIQEGITYSNLKLCLNDYGASGRKLVNNEPDLTLEKLRIRTHAWKTYTVEGEPVIIDILEFDNSKDATLNVNTNITVNTKITIENTKLALKLNDTLILGENVTTVANFVGSGKIKSISYNDGGMLGQEIAAGSSCNYSPVLKNLIISANSVTDDATSDDEHIIYFKHMNTNAAGIGAADYLNEYLNYETTGLSAVDMTISFDTTDIASVIVTGNAANLKNAYFDSENGWQISTDFSGEQVSVSNITALKGNVTARGALNPSVTNQTPVNEITLSGGAMVIELLDEAFANTNDLEEGKFTVTGISGITITTLTEITATTATAQLAFTGSDFDTDQTINIEINADQVKGASAVNGIIDVMAKDETATVTGSISEVGGDITLNLTDVEFNDDQLAKGSFSLTGAPTGVEISTVTYQSTTSATISLVSDGTDFDTDATVSVIVDASELTNGGDLTSATFMIEAINPVIAPTDAQTLTIGTEGTQLTVTGNAGNAVQWVSGTTSGTLDTDIAGATNLVYKPMFSEAGTYYVACKIAEEVSNEVMVWVKSSDVTLATLSTGGTLEPAFDAATTSYTVSLSSGTTGASNVAATATHANASVEITQATDVTSAEAADRTATIVVTAEDGVSKQTYTVVFSVSTVSVERLDATAFSMYPNPTNDMINIKSEAAISNISVYNLLGAKVKTIENLQVKNYQMNLKSFGQGIYFVEINTNKGTAVQKVLVK